jgi:uncharacterized protein (DUF2336 family)
MRFSGEQNTCIANCKKKSRSLVPINLCNQLRCPAVDVHDSRALLSLRLGPVPVAPPKILRVLACDDAIEVASPVLAQAEALDIGTLIECPRTKNQEHLLAISRRKTLPENLTEVLVVATSRSC